MTDVEARPGAGRLFAGIGAGFVAGPIAYWGPFLLIDAIEEHQFGIFLNLTAPAMAALVFMALRRPFATRGRAWPIAVSMLAGVCAAAPMALWALMHREKFETTYFSPLMWIVAPHYCASSLALPLTALVLLGFAVDDRMPDRRMTKKVPGAYVLRE